MLALTPKSALLLTISVLGCYCYPILAADTASARAQDPIPSITIELPSNITILERTDSDKDWTWLKGDSKKRIRLQRDREYRIDSFSMPPSFFGDYPALARFKIIKLSIGFTKPLTAESKKTLAHLQTVSEVDLSRVSGPADAAWLAQLANLKQVHLPRGAVEKSLVEALLQRESLHTLALRGGDKVQFSLGILAGSRLQSLSLHGWDLQKISMPPLPQLTDLELRSCSIGSSLMESLSDLPELTELDLFRSTLLVDDLSGLRACQELQTLSLVGCSEVNDKIFAGLRGHPTIESISLDWSAGGRHIGSRSAPNLSAASIDTLSLMPSLSKLSLWKSPLAKPESLVELARNQSIEELSLSGRHLGAAIPTFAGTNRLQSLRIIDSMSETLAQSLTKIKSLKKLDIKRAYTTAAEMASFSKVRPDVVVLTRR